MYNGTCKICGSNKCTISDNGMATCRYTGCPAYGIPIPINLSASATDQYLKSRKDSTSKDKYI